MKKKPTFSLKDQLFNKEKVAKIAGEIAAVYAPFEKDEFMRVVVEGFASRELKERIVWIRENLKVFLPDDYRTAVGILLEALPEELDPTKTDDDFGSFILSPYSDYVARYGCTEKDLSFSLQALKEMTKRFSVEDSIRYFLIAFPDETLEELRSWAQDENYHVRRLVSEGTRPSLPWSQKIDLCPNKTLSLLDLLHADPTRYVVRSVANHMNDISKIDPDLTVGILTMWKEAGRQDAGELDYLVRHSLRTLVKRGNKKALKLLGFSQAPGVDVKDFSLKNDVVKIGDDLVFSFTLDARKDEKLMIDYLITFVAKNQSNKNRTKVFKIAQRDVRSGESYAFTKKHALRPMSTWALYPGVHSVALQINGKAFPASDFILKE